MKVTDADVRYVADLANLKLTPAEQAAMERDLNSILEYIGQLSELDTSSVEPMAQVAQIADSASLSANLLRPDEPRNCLPRSEAMTNAPNTDGTFFRVPKVIER